ncbi:MAG: cob(I)yrinic acid a,c-diamide adenosyltransferase [Verrucomicrobiota bacterium]
MSITTKKGDDGTTEMMYGRRVSKSHGRIRICGALDELNAALGVARAATQDTWTKEQILAVQKNLISIMGEVVTDDADREKYEKSDLSKLQESDLHRLDEGVKKIESEQKPFTDWIIPGKNPTSAWLDWTRVVCRRTEREIVALSEDTQTCWCPLRPLIIQYINRLSDFLWLLARKTEKSF